MESELWVTSWSHRSFQAHLFMELLLCTRHVLSPGDKIWSKTRQGPWVLKQSMRESDRNQVTSQRSVNRPHDRSYKGRSRELHGADRRTPGRASWKTRQLCWDGKVSCCKGVKEQGRNPSTAQGLILSPWVHMARKDVCFCCGHLLACFVFSKYFHCFCLGKLPLRAVVHQG